MTGLIAMAIVTKYHRPCMIGRRNSHDKVQGSIRSDGNFAGIPSFKQFLENSKMIDYVAGHDSAAGFGIYSNKIDQLMHYANTTLSSEDFENCYIVDYILNAKNDNSDLLTELAGHPEYFGNHIEEIKLVIKDIPLQNIFAMGANKDSMRISYNNVDYIRFKDADFVNAITTNRTQNINVYGRANLNTFNGKTSIQIFIDDYEFALDEHRFDF